MRPSTVVLLAACSLAWGAPASFAAVAGTPLAALPNAALQLTAYDGYVVFSQRDAAGRWELMAWHAGTIVPLDVPERAVPFDANAGPSAAGAPTVVFSKCAHDPSGREEWGMASGCHVYELALPDGTPRLVRGIYAPGASDTTPAIWMGNIAFARLTRGARAPALYVWDRASGRLRRVGAGPSACEAYAANPPCNTAPKVLAWVQEMSLDGGSLAYQWALPETEQVGGAAFAEIRLDPLEDGRQDAPSRVVFYSIAGGACNGEEGGSPDAVGASVLFVSHRSVCVGEPLESYIGSYATVARKHSYARASPLAVAVAQDHGTTYWIRLTDAFKEKNPQLCKLGPGECEPAPDSYAETCEPALSACTLMRTEDLAGELKPY
jgi:hypothetical protein